MHENVKRENFYFFSRNSFGTQALA